MFDDDSEPIAFRTALERFYKSTPSYKSQHKDNILKISRNAIIIQANFIKEVIFEEVRINYFLHLPSRKT